MFVGFFAFQVDSFAQEVPACRADFNKDGIVTIDDIYYLMFDYDGDDLWALLNVNEDNATDGDDGIAILNLIEQKATHQLGDFNGDGMVATADLLILLASYNGFNPCVDLTGDGWVQLGDLVALLTIYWGP